MTDAPTLGEYSKHSTLNEVYDMFANLGGIKEFFYDWGGLNKWLFKVINDIRGDDYDRIMLLINKMGEHKQFPYFLIGLSIYVVFSLIIRKLRKKGSIRPRLTMWFGIYLVLFAGFMVNWGVITTLKDHFGMPRPYVELATENVHVLEIRDSDDGYRSFPSGHVSFITFLIIALWPAFNERWRWYALLLPLAVGWARISLGVHYPADVLGGFTISAIDIIVVRAVIYTTLRKVFNIVC